MPVHNYIGDLLEIPNPEAEKEYGLEPFEMKIQSIERTFVDKVFAVCDYYCRERWKSIPDIFTICINCNH